MPKGATDKETFNKNLQSLNDGIRKILIDRGFKPGTAEYLKVKKDIDAQLVAYAQKKDKTKPSSSTGSDYTPSKPGPEKPSSGGSTKPSGGSTKPSGSKPSTRLSPGPRPSKTTGSKTPPKGTSSKPSKSADRSENTALKIAAGVAGAAGLAAALTPRGEGPKGLPAGSRPPKRLSPGPRPAKALPSGQKALPVGSPEGPAAPKKPAGELGPGKSTKTPAAAEQAAAHETSRAAANRSREAAAARRRQEQMDKPRPPRQSNTKPGTRTQKPTSTTPRKPNSKPRVITTKKKPVASADTQSRTPTPKRPTSPNKTGGGGRPTGKTGPAPTTRSGNKGGGGGRRAGGTGVPKRDAGYVRIGMLVPNKSKTGSSKSKVDTRPRVNPRSGAAGTRYGTSSTARVLSGRPTVPGMQSGGLRSSAVTTMAAMGAMNPHANMGAWRPSGKRFGGGSPLRAGKM